MNNQIR